MSLAQEKVLTSELKPGMYVARLDRPWLETPFKVQGFLLKSQKNIDYLAKHCDFVYIDIEKSEFTKDQADPKVSHLSDEEQKQLLINAKPRRYEEKVDFKSELETAYGKHEQLCDATTDVIALATKNEKIHLPTIKKAVMPMVESVIRNPGAFSWLAMMKKLDGYAYNHSVSASIWAAAFGRNLGLPIKDIQAVAMGALLFDVGKARLPEKLILNPNRYNKVEYKMAKTHVEHSLDIVGSIKGIRDDVVEMVATHHERHDGNGYPSGLKGSSIPLFGKLAGIIDCYDAITSDRHYASAISPHEAVKKLYDWSGTDFQSELVEQFIQVVGVYPVGTLVELSDGRVGVVVAHHRVRRLRPRVMMVLSKNKELYKRFKIENLYEQEQGEDGLPLNIIRSVEPKRYGIDPSQFYL